MAFTNLSYDKDTMMMSETISTKPGQYHLSPPINPEAKYQTNPSIRLQKMGNSLSNADNWRFFAGPVDVESELINIRRPASKCPHNKYQPICNDCYCLNQGEVCGGGVVGGCNVVGRPVGARCTDKGMVDMPDFEFQVQYTRLTDPVCMFKEQHIDRFEYPLHPPQEKIFFPSRANMDTRSFIKDGYTKNLMCGKSRRVNF